MAFVLSHVNARHELDVDLPAFANDVRWGAVLGVMYWVQGLAARTIVIDPRASREINLGYNTRDLVVFAFTILASGAVVVFRQSNRMPASGWTVLGPLLAFRFVFDLALSLRVTKASR